MDLNTIVDIGTLISVAVASLGLIGGVVVYRRQMNAQLFLEYTKRYEEILNSFPKEAKFARLNLSGSPPESSYELTTAVLRYLNLSSEEYYLCKCGYLSKGIWKIWQDELNRTLKSPLLLREWKTLKTEFESYPEFINYVEGIQIANRG